MNKRYELATNADGKIAYWRCNGSALLVDSPTGTPVGASLYLSHHGAADMSRESELSLKLEESGQSKYSLKASDAPESLRGYNITVTYVMFGQTITCQTVLTRNFHCREESPLPMVGLMFRFATEGRQSALYIDEKLVADSSDELNFKLLPHFRYSSQNRIEVRTNYGLFEFTPVDGVHSIMLDTSQSDQFFGVMLVGDVMGLASYNFIQTFMLRHTTGG